MSTNIPSDICPPITITTSGNHYMCNNVAPHYYRYDDLVISAEAAEDIRKWAMNCLTEHLYEDVDLSNVDPDTLKELDDFISKPRTYSNSINSSNELETKSLVGTFYKTEEQLEDDRVYKSYFHFNIDDEVAKDIITFSSAKSLDDKHLEYISSGYKLRGPSV